MNRNDYRRALLMLRSLKTGVSGYVRLERRTLIGTLQFTINGAPAEMKLHAILLYRKNGCWSAVKLEQFGAPRYGQCGLLWKCDPRNIEGRTLEQYDLTAVIGIRSSGVCDLLLCGNLNGSVDADWDQVREVACRLFSPVRISGTPIAPIGEAKSGSNENDLLQTLPDFSGETPLEPVEEPTSPPEEITSPEPDACTAEETSSSESTLPAEEPAQEPDELDLPAADVPDAPEASAYAAPADDFIERDDLDTPADILAAEPDELDTPAQDSASGFALLSAQSDGSDELDAPAQDASAGQSESAGDQLELTDPDTAWPDSIEPLRKLFFTSEAIVPFEAEEFVFIRAPLPEECGASSCLCGLCCENGKPARVCYAIPAPYSPEPPAGLEGYVWRGDRHRGYWVICESVSQEIDD